MKEIEFEAADKRQSHDFKLPDNAPLWQKIKALEDNSNSILSDYATARATIEINFGEKGRYIPGLSTYSRNLLSDIILVIEHYDNILKEHNLGPYTKKS